ncbi:MAG: hypothetical protein OEY59_05470 [Deltaproteobacteria bacterium]|nr:hypothetical protein [Deltaproteobacteria bacterium]
MLRKQTRRILVFALFFFLTVPVAMSQVVYTIDFSNEADGNAQNWFKINHFELERDADEIKAVFENGKLVLETEDDILGLFSKQMEIKGATRIRVEWGVDRYPIGADWTKGVLREALTIVVSFGKEKISSGSSFIPNVPYFIGLFIGEKEIKDKVYLGKYFREGGRYFCLICGGKAGEMVISEFEFDSTFKEQFKKAMPDISAVTFEIDTRDVSGGSRAFIKKIEFLK